MLDEIPNDSQVPCQTNGPKENDVSGTRNHQILSPNVGMIDAKYSRIPVGFITFLINGRAQHDVWVCMRVDIVTLLL